MKAQAVRPKFHVMSKRKLVLLFFDLLCVLGINAVYYFLAVRASYSTPVDDFMVYVYNSLILTALIFISRLSFGVYSNVWRYTNTLAYLELIAADCIGGIVSIVICRLTAVLYIGVWHAFTVAALSALVALAARFSYRIIYKQRNKDDGADARIMVAIVGAGQLGAILASELNDNPRSHYKPLFFIDRDKNKIGQKVCGLPVFKEESIDELADKYSISEFIIAITHLTSDEANEVYLKYAATGRKIKIYDSPIHEGEEAGENEKRVVREVSIEDLLFRHEINVESSASREYYVGKTVLVTGGGGSIGSELCRQIAKCEPKKLIILDIYENNAYDIQQELTQRYGDSLDLSVEIASVRDRQRLDAIFKMYRPDVVFHAAAHKHVPLMEHNACEAIKNNVIGTYNTADMAEKYGAAKFILISTDKAVNPTNVMGASKRLCEMVVQCRKNSTTSFAAVRFGNVLGSNGSVIPLFKKQIASGGPVTITDKRIIRYFMTIPEASRLVMQAGAMAERGELFVLDMGKPVKIYDLAVNMIKLSGFEPDVDIKIEEIGLRPGEKLYEELLMKSETLDKTASDMIFVEKDTPLTRREVDKKIDVLTKAVEQADSNGDMSAVKRAIIEVVPTFKDADLVNSEAENSEEMKLTEDAELCTAN